MHDGMQDFSTRLLIVDVAPAIRVSIFYLLGEAGYSVWCAEDGFTGLAEIRKEIPDILLSDLNMPGMSGFELCSVARRRFPSIQVIAMSGSISGDDVPHGVIADAFYQKGSSAGSLLGVINAMPHSLRINPTQRHWPTYGVRQTGTIHLPSPM